jgi:hypothetical protein
MVPCTDNATEYNQTERVNQPLRHQTRCIIIPFAFPLALYKPNTNYIEILVIYSNNDITHQLENQSKKQKSVLLEYILTVLI